MILDGLLLFDTALALTSDQVSTNVIDLQNARDMGIGDPEMKLVVTVGTAFASTTSSTLVISFQGSTDNSTFTTMALSPSIAKASMVANARLWDTVIPRIVPGQALPRYLRLSYDVVTADFTAGTLTAALVLDRNDYIAYRAGVQVVN